MKQTKHTDGPWLPMYVTNALDGKLCDDYDVDIYGGDQPNDVGLLVAKMPVKDQNDIVICEDEVRANAHLIAAAPDLLESLTKVMTILENNYQLWDEYVASGDVRNNPLANKKTQTIADLAYDSINKANGKDL